MSKRATPLYPVMFFFALLLTAGALENALTPIGIADGYLVSSGGRTPSLDAVAHAADEFRIVAANILWIRVVDHYHHQFMASGGAWSQNTALMPYLRMIVWLDPHFIEAYEVGGSILAATHRYRECDEYLGGGTKNNPDSWELYYDRAMLRAWYLRQPAAALPFAQHALERASDPFDRQRIARFCQTLERRPSVANTVGTRSVPSM